LKNNITPLIHSLSQSEKRYFKLFAAQQGDDKNYIKLFDLIAGQKESDEKAILRKIKDKNFILTLPVIKNYLYKQILKSLRSYQTKHSVEFQIHNILSEVDILKKKGLPLQSLKLIKKGLNLTSKYQLPNLELTLLRKKISLAFSSVSKEYESFLLETTKEIEIATLNSKYYNKIYSELLFWSLLERKGKNETINFEDLKKKWKRIKNELPEIEKLSFYPKVYYVNIESKIARFGNDKEKLLELSEKLLRLWKSNPHIIEQKPNEYIVYANNYLISCQYLKYWHKFPPLLKELKKLSIQNFNQAGEAFQVIAFQELFYLLNTQKFEEAEKSVAYIEEGLEKYKAKVHDARRLTFYYNISILYMMMKNYDKALDWMLKIVTYQKTEHRLDLQRIAPFFELIYHYELGNLMLVNSKITTLRIRMRRKGKLSDFEKSLLSNLKKLCTKVGKDELEAIRKKFLEEMELIHESEPGLGTEECVIWLKDKSNK